MRPLRRTPANKRSSSRSFSNATRRTKALNLHGPQRGGWRL